MATLTYVYADSTAVVGPLATAAEPHSYDLCDAHAGRLTVPRGWDVVRPSGEWVPAPVVDDLTALAEAVREEAAVEPSAAYPLAEAEPAGVSGRPTHLRVLPGRPQD